MASSSTLDPENFPTSGNTRGTPLGHDIKSLGPSDSSDSGSDVADAGASLGDLDMDDNSDRFGTGEHLTAGTDPDIRVSGDIGADRIVGADEAGLGGGLDQAEEAQLGVKDDDAERG